MNKTEFVDAFAAKTGFTKADSKKAVDAFLETVTDALKDGDKVSFIGFGTFESVNKPAREARNPRTGETMKVKASNQPKFKAGAGLKEAVNEKPAKKTKKK